MSLTRKRNKTFSFRIEELKSIREAISNSIQKFESELASFQTNDMKAKREKSLRLVEMCQMLRTQKKTLEDRIDSLRRRASNIFNGRCSGDAIRKAVEQFYIENEELNAQLEMANMALKEAERQYQENNFNPVSEEKQKHLVLILNKHKLSLELINNELHFINKYLVDAGLPNV